MGCKRLDTDFFNFLEVVPSEKRAREEKKRVSFYAGNYIYEKDNNGETLQFFSHPEGYVEKDGSIYTYVYQYKDHLNNVRLNYKNIGSASNPNLQITKENSYYPFGSTHQGYNDIPQAGVRDHKYGFGNKEEQDELGLEWIDITARNYDPALGRWMNIDPLAELMRRHSPYNYAFDNPIYFLDPDG
ncbi:MAG: RHS repeat-associated core domain-containing protein, partial [Bacteroidota bacterium]